MGVDPRVGPAAPSIPAPGPGWGATRGTRCRSGATSSRPPVAFGVAALQDRTPRFSMSAVVELSYAGNARYAVGVPSCVLKFNELY